jgi:hypothetical protein
MPFRLAIDDGRFARTLEVRAQVLTVGAAASSGLRLESEGVERRHAEIRQIGRRLVAEDLGTKAGLRVGGRRVRRALLAAGDVVFVGDARIRISDVEPILGPTPVPHPRRTRTRRVAPAVVSIALHAAALILLQGAVLFAGATPTETFHLETAALERPAQIEDAPELVPLSEPADLVPRQPDDVELLPPEEEVPDVPLAASDPRLQPPPKTEPETVPPEPARTEEPPPTVGLGGVAAEIGERAFGKGDAASANRISAGLLETDGDGGPALRGLRSRSGGQTVWVIRGDYDQAEKVLDHLGVGHSLLGRDALETHDLPSSLRVMVFNCTGRPLSPEAQQRVAAWVRSGGWLVTTDWGVERLIERGMPGTLTPLRRNERPVLTKDETVGVKPTTDRGFDAGVPQEDGARWWLEDSSVPFTIAPGIGAEILVRSGDMERRHGEGTGAVAVTFPYGEGRVLHLLGHVFQQEGNLRGTLLVHRIVVNFLAAALQR